MTSTTPWSAHTTRPIDAVTLIVRSSGVGVPTTSRSSMLRVAHGRPCANPEQIRHAARTWISDPVASSAARTTLVLFSASTPHTAVDAVSIAARMNVYCADGNKTPAPKRIAPTVCKCSTAADMANRAACDTLYGFESLSSSCSSLPFSGPPCSPSRASCCRSTLSRRPLAAWLACSSSSGFSWLVTIRFFLPEAGDWSRAQPLGHHDAPGRRVVRWVCQARWVEWLCGLGFDVALAGRQVSEMVSRTGTAR